MHCVGLDLAYWDYVKDDIDLALKGSYSNTTANDLYERILTKNVQLWALHDGNLSAVMTTEIINYDRLKSVRIITVTGKDSELWLDVLIDTISRWGAENGAESIEFCGRRGWEKVLSKRGFDNLQIVMKKPIKRCEALEQ
jgi:hypothetical protein